MSGERCGNSAGGHNIAKCIISDKKIRRVSFLPAYINKQNQPFFPAKDDKLFNDVIDYMKDCTVNQGLNAKFDISDDEVVISDGGPVIQLWLPTVAIPIIDRIRPGFTSVNLFK